MGIYDEIEHVEVPRSYFNRSKTSYMSIEVGKIIPIYTAMLFPNDLVKLRGNTIIRQQPTISPSLSNYVLTTRTFVLAIRNLNKDFYRYLSGYKEYSLQSKYEEPLKYWKPIEKEEVDIGTLWDYLGYPTLTIPDEKSCPIDYPRQMYNYIYDLYFRNQSIQKSILEDGDPTTSTNKKLLEINWGRDYFTTALPFQQLSDPIALPITGNTKAEWKTDNITPDVVSPQPVVVGREGSGVFISEMGVTGNAQRTQDLRNVLDDNVVDMNNISSVLISDLRYAFALQLYAEMMARGGIRDNEFLMLMYGTAPSDEALQRPKYLGGSKTNILTSEVLQTSGSDATSSLGELGGHGLGVGVSNEITYHAKEFCIIMTVAYIKPNVIYAQGMPAEWTQKTKYDFPMPVFGHLAEQPVRNREIMCLTEKLISPDGSIAQEKDITAEEYNDMIWGYRPIYDWAREAQDSVHGLLKPEIYYQKKMPGTPNPEIIEIPNTKKYNLYNWTEARYFTGATEGRPHLNDSFLKCKIDNRNYAITDETVDRAQFIMAYEQEAHYWRPLTAMGTPGRVDHVV